MNLSSILKRFFIISFLIMAGLPLTSNGQNFEGVIHYTFPGDQNAKLNAMKYMIKGKKVRMQMGQGSSEGAMLFFPEKSEMVVLINSMHGYMKMKTNRSNNDEYSSKWKHSKMEKTGQTKTIAEHSCEVWKVANDSGDTLTMCLAAGMGSFVSPGNPMTAKNAPAWAHKIVDKQLMPLEVIESSDGEQKVQMRATKIEEKSLASDLFAIPDGYRDMSAMMKKMKNKQQH